MFWWHITVACCINYRQSAFQFTFSLSKQHLYTTAWTCRSVNCISTSDCNLDCFDTSYESIVNFCLLVRMRVCAFVSRDGYHCHHHECRMRSTNVWTSIMYNNETMGTYQICFVDDKTPFLVDFIFMLFFSLRKVFQKEKIMMSVSLSCRLE